MFTETPAYFDLEVKVNGENVSRRVPTHQRLLDFLRETLQLTGTKEACGEGECGACTVILDGETVNSCLVLAVETHGSEIKTIEGITSGEPPAEIQETFVAEHAVQCGYCTPGFILSAMQLLNSQTEITDEQVREGLEGNICRCTGYQKIHHAVANAGTKP
ncbi:MAG: (2Fe-2S)-binding protein [Fidelibacterota bacterium]|nr:MAG: (2Fe-2S)-binding protein [Candidatus Neomarinimicrobiota bacterium]